MGLAFQPDGAASPRAAIDRMVKSWDLATGQPLAFRGHGGWVSSLEFSPDGGRVVPGGGAFVGLDRSVRIWDASTGQRVLCVRRASSPRPDSPGSAPMAGTSSRSVPTPRSGSGTRRTATMSPSRSVRTRAVPHRQRPGDPPRRPGARHRTPGRDDPTLGPGDAERPTPSRVTPARSSALAYSPRGDRLASTAPSGGRTRQARPGGELKLWDVRPAARWPPRGGGSASSGAWRSAPTAAASSWPKGFGTAGRHEALVWDAETGRELVHPPRPHRQRPAVAFSPDGTPASPRPAWDRRSSSGTRRPARRSSPFAATPPASTAWPSAPTATASSRAASTGRRGLGREAVEVRHPLNRSSLTVRSALPAVSGKSVGHTPDREPYSTRPRRSSTGVVGPRDRGRPAGMTPLEEFWAVSLYDAQLQLISGCEGKRSPEVDQYVSLNTLEDAYQETD